MSDSALVWIARVGAIAGFCLPLFNIPLIVRLVKRKRAADFDMTWLIGVLVCIWLMTPQALMSTDSAFRLFGIMNFIFFTIVAILILKYRKNG